MLTAAPQASIYPLWEILDWDKFFIEIFKMKLFFEWLKI